MRLSDMLTLLQFYIDDTIDAQTATMLFNDGQNIMATEVSCIFPQLDASEINSTFVFPETYHGLPIKYAAGMFKAYDSSIRESQNYLDLFYRELPNFSKTYTPPMRYRVGFDIGQYTVGDPVDRTYDVNFDGFDPNQSRLKVFINDKPTTDFTTNQDKTFTINTTTTLVPFDRITIQWLTDTDLIQSPFAWWEGLP